MKWINPILFSTGVGLTIFGVGQIFTPLAWVIGGLMVLRVSFVIDEGVLNDYQTHSRRSFEERDISFADIWKRGLDTLDIQTTAGEVVNYDTALTLSAVFGATRLLSDSISTLPFDIKFRREGVERPFRLFPAFMDKMNPYLNNHDVLNQIMMSSYRWQCLRCNSTERSRSSCTADTSRPNNDHQARRW